MLSECHNQWLSGSKPRVPRGLYGGVEVLSVNYDKFEVDTPVVEVWDYKQLFRSL